MRTLKEKMTIIREQEELDILDSIPSPEDAMKTFEDNYGEDMESVHSNLNHVQELSGHIEDAEDAIQKLNNPNITIEEVVAAEMMLHKIKYDCGFSDERLGLESIKSCEDINSKSKELVLEFKSIKEELIIAREGIIGDMIDKVKNIVTGFKDNVSDSVKKVLSKLTGTQKQYDFKKHINDLPELSYDVMKSLAALEAGKIKMAHDAFGKSVKKITMDNINTLPKIPLTVKYVVKVTDTFIYSVAYGEVLYECVQTRDGGRYNSVSWSFGTYLENQANYFSKFFPDFIKNKYHFTKGKGSLTSVSDAQKLDSFAINFMKTLKNEDIDKNIDLFSNIDKFLKEAANACDFADIISVFLKQGDVDSKYDGLNYSLNLNVNLASFLITAMFGSICLVEVACDGLTTLNKYNEAVKNLEK